LSSRREERYGRRERGRPAGGIQRRERERERRE
jgi:hypothetical protein